MPWKPQFENDFPTLGYEVTDWIETYLSRPDTSEYEPFRLYQEQLDFIAEFYRLNPATGRRIYHRGVLSRPRGWGKSPLAGALCAVEGMGPVLFDGWDANGQPVGKPWSTIRTPLVNIAAVSEDQTQNTYSSLLEMLDNDVIFDDYPGLEPMGGFVNLPRGKIKPISASGATIKGARAVFGIMDQALALDTPIPTPNGWTTMGELKAGQKIYGSDGIVTVVEAKPVSTEHDCYRVTFRDGTSVVASAGHLWQSRRTGWPVAYRDKVRMTEEMLDGYSYRIPASRVMDSPEVKLPADPYLLGLWLGDGTRGKCEITVGKSDIDDVVAIFKRRGIFTNVRQYLRDGELDRCYNLSFSERAGYQGANRPVHAREISGLGCYFDKHVPEIFFTGSAAQRIELLQGLMDSDGCATEQGVCTFVNTNLSLANAVVRLLRSLGQVTTGVKTISDKRYSSGKKYRVDFTPRHNIVPFKLGRKAERVKSSSDDHISIVSIEPVERVPVRCIAVDSDDHLFAFGEAGHLTHNTEVWYKRNGGHKLASTMRSNAAKIGGTTLETPNAFIEGEESVAEESAKNIMRMESGEAINEGIFWAHREAPSDTDMSEDESLMMGLRVAYGDASGHPDGCVIHDPPCPPGHVDLHRLMAEIHDLGKDPQVSRSDFLNQITNDENAWMEQHEWLACEDREKVVKPGDTIVLGFDGSRGRVRGNADATALVGMRVEDRHLFPIRVWEARQGEKDWQAPVMEVDREVRDAFKQYNVVGFYADPSGWETHVAAWEAEFGKKLKLKATPREPIALWPRGKNSKVSHLTEMFYTAVRSNEITHDGSAVMLRHVMNCRRRRATGGGYLLYKEFPESPNKIDAAYAAIMAFRACLDANTRGIGQRKKGPRFVVMT